MTNDETRMTKETRMTNARTKALHHSHFRRWFVIRVSSFFRHSNFVIRVFTSMSDQQQLATIKSLALAQLAELRAAPKPSYSLDGQSVSWETYAASLEQTVDWCDRKLAALVPFEIRSEATT